ncbi:MAG: M28 family peptidase [Rhodothermales bacterium]|nr:M28 family peptidase [Rhodothermales bacterium]
MHHLAASRLRLSPFVVLLSLIAVPACFAQSDAGRVASPADTPTALENPSLVQQYQATITESDLAAHLYVFASDYFEGRETATRGQKLAAMYLAGQYRKMGLDAKGNHPGDNAMAPERYFQPFPLYGRSLKAARLDITAGGRTVANVVFSAAEQSANAYLAAGNAMAVNGPVIFAGYGIEDDALGYNDFKAMEAAGLSVADSWLMVLLDEPLVSAEKSLLPTQDGAPSRWTARGNTKRGNMMRREGGRPRGVLVVGDLGPNGKPTADQARRAAAALGGVGQLSLEEQAGGAAAPPYYVISSALANQIIAPAGKTVEALKAGIDSSLQPTVFAVPDVMLSSAIEHEAFQTTSENVAAFIEGSDPALKDEVVVISSHYDHVGMNEGGEGDIIFNGADDDGSGTVAVLEMAEAFKTAQRDGNGPRRSILFLNVSGEEKGLLGSAYYSDSDPLVPVANTVTNLNIDMIGRYDPTHPSKSKNYVYIIGSNLISQELHDLNAQVNTATGTHLELDERFNSKDDPNQFYRRSDHWNFGKHGVPFIFFFTGTHEDYHGLEDEAEKIEYERMARITRLIFATAWQVANQDERPAVSGAGFN